MKPLLIIILLAVITGSHCFSQIFSSSLDTVPRGWTGPVFKLSAAYPKKLSKKQSRPWLQFNFKTQPEKYMNAVLQYFLEGNKSIDFVVQKNKTRKWYHAPSMSWQQPGRAYGREFIHGLTKERSSPARELFPTQTNFIQNWAVGFYNAPGAYTFGKVWADTNNLQTADVSFPEGTVTAKLLFTAASPEEVPYVDGSLAWTANINKIAGGITIRSPQTVRLLQVDIAVKDARANAFTGWVFGTFAYHADAPGKTVWTKLVPAGLMWGNDPGKFKGEPLSETWINPAFITLFTFPNGDTMHTGFQGRLNGPVDNPGSSCMSCHASAQSPQFKPMIPSSNSTDNLNKFFRNVPSGEAFDGKPASKSMDYSLQLSGGVAAALANRNDHTKKTQPTAGEVKKIDYFITTVEDSAGPLPIHSWVPDTASVNKKVTAASSPAPAKNKMALVLYCACVVPVFLLYRLFNNKPYRKTKQMTG
ncbi:MAG: hypothetical protein ABIQ88_13155 [Chitinophagaceae bacterium]